MSKKSPNIWATFARKFVAKNFQKLPNLVTLLERERERAYEGDVDNEDK